MADPLSNHPIARFVRFGNSMLDLGVDIHNSGEVTIQALRLDRIQVKDLATMSKTLKTPRYVNIGCLDEMEQRLVNVGSACGMVLDDLLLRVDRLRVESIKHQHDQRTLVQALQKAWSKTDVDALRQRLPELRLELKELVKASSR